MSGSASMKLLQNQLKQIMKEPSGFFHVELKDESNLFEWIVYISGPQGTPYEGGIFKALLTFPNYYPYEPPKLKFLSEFWHPNVYENGNVCISILHPPGEDEMSGERPEERWLPIHTPETILLSVISMLADPNCSSPANVDASVEYRDKPVIFAKRVKSLVDKSKKELPEDFVMPKPAPVNTNPDPADHYLYADEDDYEFEDDYDAEGDDYDEMEYDEDEYDEELSPLNEEDRKLLEEESQEKE